MRLAIFEHLDNNHTRLEYTNTPTKPRTAPAYIMPEQKADEFVKKYNKKTKQLEKLTLLLIGISSLATFIKTARSKAQIIPATIKSVIAGSIGLITGCLISNHQKNKLMNEYHVEEI